MSVPVLKILSCVALCTIAASLPCQKKKKPPKVWSVDPYTKGDKAAMKKAGYVAFGTMPWGDHHSTLVIRKIMPEVPLKFVETAHFRIGSSLEALPMPQDSKRKRALAKELKALKKRIPGIKGRKVDPWLRLHLYAMRLENLYEQWKGILGVKDSDFPQKKVPYAKPGKWPWGRGPYLGMQEKFTVLLFKKPENLFRYCKSTGWKQSTEPMPASFAFFEFGSMFFGTATHFKDIPLKEDHELHCHLLHAVAQNLLNGYRSYRHSLPAWLEDGLPNYVLRKLDPEEYNFSGLKGASFEDRHDPHWEVNVRRLLKNDFAPPFKEICSVKSPNELTLNAHMVAWSLVDYMRSIDGGKPFGKFLGIVKGENPGTAFSLMLKLQDKACKEAFGTDLTGLRAGWEKYVKKTYPKR